MSCETRLAAVRTLLLISGLACVAGILLAWLTMSLISSRAIQPMIQNVIRQKQFITDAGHELKTPLTVISANMDALSLTVQKNEWIEDTQKQVSNMRGLVNNLIYLSRMDEEGAHLQKEDLNFSELVTEQAESFQGMAEFMGKSFRLAVRKDIRLTGDRDALKRLISQLCENAVKYAPEEDTIELSLNQEGHMVRLVSENGLTEPLSPENLKHLFDRFYRPDLSRSRESGGYGIGLSMARAIMERHDGRIYAEQTGLGRIRFVCEFPVKKR
jgi:signal transduction histidine kinase